MLKQVEIIKVEPISYGANAFVQVRINGQYAEGNKYALSFNKSDYSKLQFCKIDLSINEAMPIIDAINSVASVKINPNRPHCFFNPVKCNLTEDQLRKWAAEMEKLENEEYFDFSKV